MTSLGRSLLGVVSVVGLLAFIACWPAIIAVGFTVSLPIALIALLVVSLVALIIPVFNMKRRGLGDKVWLSVVLSLIIGLLPVTIFAFSGEGRFFIHLMTVCVSVILWLLFVLQGLRNGGLYFLSLSLVLISLFVGLPFNTQYVNSLAESQEQRLEAQQRQLAYEQAVAVLEKRLQEVDAPARLTDIERRLDLQGLPQVRANALRERLRIAARYEHDYNVPTESTFARGAAARFRDWNAPGDGGYRNRQVEKNEDINQQDDDKAVVLAAASEEGNNSAEQAATAALVLAPELYVRALRTSSAVEVLLLTAANIAAILSVIHYLAQFNALFPKINPVPIIGRLSAFGQVERAVRLESGDSQPLSFLMAEAARKGEQFLVLGDVPLPQSLPRWKIGPLVLPFGKLHILSDRTEDLPVDSQFCFEQVWYGRYACQITDVDASRAMLLDLREQLRLRRKTKASCRHIFNVIWFQEDLPPTALVEEYRYLARVLNLRLIIAGEVYEDEDIELYDSHYRLDELMNAK
jgi:hypothetical protein